MSVEDVMEFSASEINGWQEYFNIYGYTEARMDLWFAKLIQMFHNANFTPKVSLSALLPPYLTNDSVSTEPSLEEQGAKAQAFHNKLQEAKAK